MHLSSSWIAAARWSSRIDFRPLLGALNQGPGALGRSGAPGAFVTEVRKTDPLETEGVFLLGQEGYPSRLLALQRPPPVVWHRGNLALLERPALAIVGARACTPYGRATSSALAREIARREAVVVSGGARGIDTAAHEASLDEGGGTIAILGGGLDSGFTDRQRSLHTRILNRGGLLLSELPPRDNARRWTYPRRNRLIAALGRATVVVEAGSRSGARHTAEAARELALEVLAVPGRLGEVASAGCLELLADGATCVTSVADVADRVGRPLSQRLLDALPSSPLELANALDESPRAVMGLLAMLELRGIVRPMPDGRYGLR